MPGQCAALGTLAPPAGEESAEVGGGERGEIGVSRRGAQVFCHKARELAQVPCIGFQSLRRHAPLGLEGVEPALRCSCGIGGEGEGETGHGAEGRTSNLNICQTG